MFDDSKAPALPQTPRACPTCGSSDMVTTTNKTITIESYWRCLSCGEMWNPSRSREPRFDGRRTSGHRTW